MRNQIKLFLVLALLTFIGCSKDEGSSNPADQDGGIVFRSQVVTIDMGAASLSQENYSGTIAGIDVELIKGEGNKLLFMVPYDLALGKHNLEINGISHSIRYEVKQTVLPADASEVIAGFSDNMATFASTLDGSPEALAVQHSIDNFNSIFENASEEEKLRIATLYQANKATFDNIILYDYSFSGRSVDPNDITLLGKHSYAVYVMAAGAIVAMVAPDPAEKALGIAVVAVGAYKARSFFLQLLEKKLNTITLSVGNVMGTNNRNVNAELEFTDNVSTTLELNAITRSITTADAAKTQAAVVSFFEDYNKYNYWIGLVNEAIDWVNDNVPLANFDQIPLEQLPANAVLTPEAVDANTFSNMTFAVNHSNLQLVSASLSATGQLSIKIKIVGTPSSTPINSTLNYTYADEFSSFSGSLPIQVNSDTSDFLVGSWTLTHYNGTPANEFQYITSCPANPIETDTYGGYTMYGSATFTTITYNCTVGRNQVYNFCISGECAVAELCHNNSNYDPHSGTYQSNGNYQFTVLTDNGTPVSSTITVVDENHITVVEGGTVKNYVRQ